mgnify:CR=1 FL=1
MKIEIKAPTLPESVPDGTVATWHKNIGEAVKRDELLVDIETDKVVIEVVAPANGTLEKIVLQAAPGGFTLGGAGTTRMQLRVNGSLLTYEEESVANETSVTFTWSANNSFNAGDRLRISFDPTNTPKYVTATSVWKYTI